MKNFTIVRGEIFKNINQWVEIFEKGIYQTRILVGANQTDNEIKEEYFSQISCK